MRLKVLYFVNLYNMLIQCLVELNYLESELLRF